MEYKISEFIKYGKFWFFYVHVYLVTLYIYISAHIIYYINTFSKVVFIYYKSAFF